MRRNSDVLKPKFLLENSFEARNMAHEAKLLKLLDDCCLRVRAWGRKTAHGAKVRFEEKLRAPRV
ncbi:hypothetical protein A2U01_0072432 [Trifolium medium]|uniref:Uncharacterized protein n=1 Tax=Trifolium medium TaxID=97028 RepID=A0A392SQN4_9FABA|nr:hypothetical protein [Trifolium medium]